VDPVIQKCEIYNARILYICVDRRRGEGKPALIMKTPAHSKLPACKSFNIEILQL
jgi:hypothetical protein